MGKRDADDIAREEGIDALRAAFDAAAPNPLQEAPKKRDANDIAREKGIDGLRAAHDSAVPLSQTATKPNGASVRATAGRQPLPNNIELEQALLGAVFLNNEAFHRVSSFLLPKHFHEPLHGKLFEVVAELISAGRVANPLTLKGHLPPEIKKLKIGGLTIYHYLARLSADATTVINAPDYARGIVELARRRRIIEAAEDIAAAALANEDAELAVKARDAFGEIAKAATGVSQRFRLTPFREITLTAGSAFVVYGIIPCGGLVIVWGPPKCGKSFWVFDLVMHVAVGWEYRGHRVNQGPVVYFALEGGRGFRARITAWRNRHLGDYDGDVPFYLVDVPVDLIADHAAVIAAISAQLGDVAPSIVVIDTLNRALAGDENSSDDMAKFIRAADSIRLALQCAVLVVHHCGIQASRPRGHTSLSGADDAQIAVERDGADNVVATVEHMKDGEPGLKLMSRLEVERLGADEHGNEITSCIIVPFEGDACAKAPNVTGATKIALDLLIRAIDDAGEKPPVSNHIPPQVGRTCRATTWRAYCYQGTLTESDSPDAKQKAFVRASNKLQALGVIGVWSDHVWLTGQPGQART
jgi:hypothetical protein